MSRRTPYRPPAPAPRPEVPDLPRVARGGTVLGLYGMLDAGGRREVLDAIGLKHCQRIGHRHKVPALRSLSDLDAQWSVVDAWLTSPDGVGGSRAVGDLFDPLVRALIDRARELLGENADEPAAEHLAAMAETLTAERSAAVVRVLLAAVVEFDFTAAPEVRALAASDDRWPLPPL